MKKYQELEIKIIMVTSDVITESGQDEDGMFGEDIFSSGSKSGFSSTGMNNNFVV